MTDGSINKNKPFRRHVDQPAFDSALRLLTRRDHTRWELDVKLRKKGFTAIHIAGATARLEALGYLDDAKTAKILADHLVRKGYGPLRVRYALRQKGLDDAIVENALRHYDDEEQVQNARLALKKKRLRLEREADPVRRRQMAYRFLAGRGYPAMIIRRVIDVDS